ncbi:MAG: flagellar hook-basal body complex protein FliE [bacterium]|jgi:flagellar hook-basal body complex protein FliE
MSDPLGLIGGASRGVQGLPGQVVGRAGVNQPGQDGGAFKNALLQSIEQVNQLEQEATAAQEDLVTGQRADVENVILATQKADQAFRALLAVRNKVQAAYDEMKQVRI